MNPNTENRHLESKLTMNMVKGEVLRHELAGGGGWGDPLERDPLDVLRDVRNEFVSEKSAKEDYGVVVNVHNWTVNEEQTKELRSRINKSRIGKGAKVLWENWPRKAIEGAAQ